MNETLISLVVPVYNAGPWLAPCLASITAQTHTAWECILSDDGSTDGSAEACDAAAAADPRFRVVHRPNSGPNAARQAGIRLSALSSYYMDGPSACPPGTLVLGYGALDDALCAPLAAALSDTLKKACTAASASSSSV